jgi:CDP-glucose 4,6-dehydratase
MLDRTFWPKQRILLTGHTGFKGAWASLWLERLGAEVAGYALAPDHRPDLFSCLGPFKRARSDIGDLAERDRLGALAADFRPTLLLHMAAQPLVRRSYTDPAATFATNVQGTVHVLEAVRELPGLRAALVVTTDKVYRNDDEGRPFAEDDALGGHDPYSASKAAAELVTASYRASFFERRGVPLATARAGNVIGGGDWSEDRLVPDIWRALKAGKPVELRYPDATRPWQHVLDPLSGYFAYLEKLAESPAGAIPSALNFGPRPDAGSVRVAEMAESLQQQLSAPRGWAQAAGDHPPEMNMLALDSRRAAAALGWQARLSTGEAVEWTTNWYREFEEGQDMRRFSLEQIEAYEARW